MTSSIVREVFVIHNASFTVINSVVIRGVNRLTDYLVDIQGRIYTSCSVCRELLVYVKVFPQEVV